MREMQREGRQRENEKEREKNQRQAKLFSLINVDVTAKSIKTTLRV